MTGYGHGKFSVLCSYKASIIAQPKKEKDCPQSIRKKAKLILQ
jgi:hypothetical protein